MKLYILLLVTFLSIGCVSNISDGMKLSSVFSNNEKISSKYTCDGDNINPPLHITDIPEGTRSLALLVTDPDIPDFVKQKYAIQVWNHWVIFNIEPNTSEIGENEAPGTEGKTSSDDLGYQGPCPPDAEHRYFFRLYALDTMLDLKEGASREQVERAMNGHIIGQAELIGLYERE